MSVSLRTTVLFLVFLVGGFGILLALVLSEQARSWMRMEFACRRGRLHSAGRVHPGHSADVGDPRLTRRVWNFLPREDAVRDLKRIQQEGNALGESGNPGISSADLKFITSTTLPALIRVAESAADAKNSSALLPALDREAERLIPLLEKGTKTIVSHGPTGAGGARALEVVGRVTWGGGAAYLVFLMVAGRVASRRIAAPMAELVRISQGESTGGREAIQPASGPVEFGSFPLV